MKSNPERCDATQIRYEKKVFGIDWVMPNNIKEAYESWRHFHGELGYPSKSLGQWCLVLFFGASGMKRAIDVLMGFQLLAILLKQNVQTLLFSFATFAMHLLDAF
ncbi:hypothetical protein H5410_017150 [Solanum commersonii]|uniref:Uncharacterized protein n=1 Tax=Solanum commersonii TaxID=4109 RepID=A0A9J5ZYA5_SOLCO|nr:hypothetical protein H5410_017150 [Solanum commersonii]